jgi:hypothetical protein
MPEFLTWRPNNQGQIPPRPDRFAARPRTRLGNENHAGFMPLFQSAKSMIQEQLMAA